jgi:hypothetical protein
MSRARTQYYTAASLDGFIATLDDSLDWLFPLGANAEGPGPRCRLRPDHLGHGNRRQPSGGFEARVASSLGGRVRLALGSALGAGVDRGAGWHCDSLGTPAVLTLRFRDELG